MCPKRPLNELASMFMRRLILCSFMLILAGCVPNGQTGPGAEASVKGGNPITGDAVTVTAIDADLHAAAASGGMVDAALDVIEAPAAKPESPKQSPAKPTETADVTGPGAGKSGSADVQPGAGADVKAEAPPTPMIKTATQKACERKGGIFASAGKSGAKTCVKRTRDGGKQCKREQDCEGVCLARSRTCAPATPLLGCNDILQGDGRRVSLCID